MRKFLLSTTLALSAFLGNAQDYNFTVLNQPYAELSSGTVLNNKVWFYNNFAIALPFQIQIFGQDISNLSLSNGILYADDSNNTDLQYQLFAQNSELLDGGYILGDPTHNNNVANSQSPLKFQVEGTVGNRILKVEVSNAANGNENFDYETTNMRISYQFWFYENDQKIEFHYGPNSITNFNIFFNDYSTSGQLTPNFNVMIAKVRYEPNPNPNLDDIAIPEKIVTLSGSGDNPTAQTITNPAQIGKLTSYPQSGKVYQFSNDALGIEKNEKTNIRVYPNPTTDFLHVSLDAFDVNLGYQIYDVTGKVVATGQLTEQNQVDVSALHTGVYFLKTQSYKTVKFVKQ